jgi:hypothetical protein
VDDPVDNADKAGLVEGTIWAFCPQKPEDHKGDYHKVFHSKNFIAWGRGQLLPNLKQPSLIMIDNAKYHKTYPAGTHQISSLCKAQLQAYLESKSEPYGAKDTCVILRKKARAIFEKEEVMEDIVLAEAQGTTVTSSRSNSCGLASRERSADSTLAVPPW